MPGIFATLKALVTRDDMTHHGFIMVSFALVAAAINYLFQLITGIMLTPSQYGTLYSLLSLYVILTVISSAIHTSVTKYTSKYKAKAETGSVKYLWRYFIKVAVIVGLVSFIVLALASPWLASFLKIDNIWYLFILYISFILALILPVNYGLLRGLQRFAHLGLSNNFMSILKLATGVILIYLGMGVYGGLIAYILAQLFVFIITMAFLKDIFRTRMKETKIEGLRSYAGLTLVAIAAFTVLTNVDVIMVKHYLSPEITGNYSVICVLGKIAFIIPGGIIVAMFPKTSELYESNAPHYPVMLRAILLTVLLSGCVVIAYLFFSDFIVGFLYGDKYTLASSNIFMYSISQLLFAISYLMMNYFLSLNRTGVAYTMLSAFIVQIALIAMFHDSISAIINIMVISGVLSILSQIPFFFRRIHRTRRAN